MRELTKHEAEQELLESLPITKQLEAKGTKYEVHHDGIYLPDYDVLLDEEIGEEIKMTDYSKLSDFDINKLVAEKLGYKFEARHPDDDDSIQVWDGSSVIYFDPCNDPSDAWPIIDDNNIDFRYEFEEKEMPCALIGDDEDYLFWHSDKNRLRAAMIVYLMMNESNG